MELKTHLNYCDFALTKLFSYSGPSFIVVVTF